MFDYLQKFNTLPQNLRDSVSSPAAMMVISDLENKYKIDLAATVMKVMVKIIPLADLSIHFVSDFSLDQETAKKLTAELKDRLFFSVSNYLGYNPSYSLIIPKTTLAPVHFLGIEKIIKDSGVTFAGLELNSRFKSVLTTYLKGVRSRIDTRLTLNKEVISGGLGLDYKIIDKIFKSADEVVASQSLPSEPPVLPAEKVLSGLDKVRSLYQQQEGIRDIPYDLKKAISTGTIKKVETPLNLPIPKETGEKLLEEPDEDLRISAPLEVKKNEPINSAPVKIDSVKNQVFLPTPKIKINLTEDRDLSEIKIKPIALVAPVPAVVPVPNVLPTPKPTEIATNFVPVDHKITRPPEKKASLLSKLFTEETKIVNKEKEALEIKPVTQTRSSIASLRAEAAINNDSHKNSVVKVPLVSNLDNKITPKVMGPIEELAYLDIVNFRRLGSLPAEAVEKVEFKIKLLEKDGYDKMVSGVVAWRSGIINSIYLKMGLESLSKGISLKQCADNYQAAQDSSYLTWEEIENIIALNSRLMF